MANPMFWALVPSSELPATAVFMPMTCPAVSMRGPPEFPGLIAASVWIRFCRFSVAVPSPPALTDRPRAETMPWVTVGVPAASPSALPMATTASPTTALDELPKVTVGRFGCRIVDLEQRHVLLRVVADEGGRIGLLLPVFGHGDAARLTPSV